MCEDNIPCPTAQRELPRYVQAFQGHSNYHRKDIAIIQEGFQRFRATEDCENTTCQFYGQRTTHFHCIRDNCGTTFKNKADIEKHKTYHIKDEQLAKDGFRKFLKQEVCTFAACRFNLVCNHIHCIRPGCNYVLQSSGQLYSHKRKHDRQDAELGAALQVSGSESPTSGHGQASSSNGSYKMDSQRSTPLPGFGKTSGIYSSLPTVNYFDDDNEETPMPLPSDEDTWTRYMTRYPSGDVCKSECEYMYREHYHCITDNCMAVIPSGSNGDSREANEHAASHEYQDRITQSFFHTVGKSIEGDCTRECRYYLKEKHYHCIWPGCEHIVSSSDPPFKRLDHFKYHDYSDKNSKTKEELMNRPPQGIDQNLPKKRGRPSKLEKTVEAYPSTPKAVPNLQMIPNGQFAFNAMRLMANEATESNSSSSTALAAEKPQELDGFFVFNEGAACPDTICQFAHKKHFHCNIPRCHYATNREDILELHSKDFHDNIDITEFYEFYDRSVDCRRIECASNKTSRHFHCTRPGCDYSFVRFSTVSAHDAIHEKDSSARVEKQSGPIESEPQLPISSPENQRNASSSSPLSKKTSDGEDVSLNRTPTQSPLTSSCGLVKASGTYFPISGLNRDGSCKDEPPSPRAYDPQVLHFGTGGLPSSPADGTRSPSLVTPPRLTLPPGASQLFWPGLASPAAAAASSYMQSMLSLSDLHSTSNNSSTLNPLAHHLPLELQQQLAAQALASPEFLYGSAGSAALGDKRPFSFSDGSPPLVASKRNRCNASDGRSDDFVIPEGYVKFGFNEDCHYEACTYREHQTHFHCMREECAYSFCDKTRFQQHTTKHDKLDSLMGGEFSMFRVSCPKKDCSFNCNSAEEAAKSSHFHCLKCDYVCSDTGKVIAHRKQHANVTSASCTGFDRLGPGDECPSSCVYGGKQHYHCKQCDASVLSPAQMSSHRMKHLEEQEDNMDSMSDDLLHERTD